MAIREQSRVARVGVPLGLVATSLALWFGLRGTGAAPTDPAPVSIPQPEVDPPDPPAEAAPIQPEEQREPVKLAWEAKFTTPDDPVFGLLWSSPYCKVCGRELVCPDHINRLPTPAWARDLTLPHFILNAFWFIPKHLEKIKGITDPQYFRAKTIEGVYAACICLDKWEKHQPMNSGLMLGEWDEPGHLPPPIPNPQGQQPGEKGWSDFVGMYADGAITWHYTEYPLWVVAKSGQFMAERDAALAIPRIPLDKVGGAIDPETWHAMVAEVEGWYGWLCAEFERARDE